MNSSIQKWGNSQGVRIPLEMIKKLSWNISDPINIDIVDDSIIIRRVEPPKKKIEELFENYNEEYKPEAIDWGEPVGREIW